MRHDQTKHREEVVPTCTKSRNPDRIPTGLSSQEWCLLPHQSEVKTAAASSSTVPDAADLIPEGSFGQVLTADCSACGWMLLLGVAPVCSGQHTRNTGLVLENPQ